MEDLHFHHTRADTAARPYAETFINIKLRGSHSDICNIDNSRHPQAEQRDARWNEERVGRKPDIPRYGDCKPARIRRLAGRAPSKMVNYTTASRIPKSHHRGWSTHLASRRDRLAQPDHTENSGFVTPGGIGTHGIHPPRKRIPVSSETGITAKSNRCAFVCGRAQWPSPTQRICCMRRQFQNRKASFCNIRRPRHARDSSTAQADLHRTNEISSKSIWISTGRRLCPPVQVDAN